MLYAPVFWCETLFFYWDRCFWDGFGRTASVHVIQLRRFTNSIYYRYPPPYVFPYTQIRNHHHLQPIPYPIVKHLITKLNFTLLHTHPISPLPFPPPSDSLPRLSQPASSSSRTHIPRPPYHRPLIPTSPLFPLTHLIPHCIADTACYNQD